MPVLTKACVYGLFSNYAGGLEDWDSSSTRVIESTYMSMEISVEQHEGAG